MCDPLPRREWGAFLDDLVHELRTPLTSIGGYAALLVEEEQELPPVLQHVAGVIDAQSERLGAQLATLLEIARLWSGKRPPELRRLDLAALTRGAARRLGITGEPGGPVWGRADRALIGRAVKILLDNAVRHGAQPLSVATERADGGARIAVCDAGPGVPERAVPLIGRRPFQGGSDEVLHTGTGLSLVLAATIAELHHGVLTYHSVPGRTRFTLMLG